MAEWIAAKSYKPRQHVSSTASSAQRQFGPNGATRDIDDGKLDFEGFLSPLVIEAYGRYMHICRKTPAGLRDSDNWQQGIPLNVYMKSKWRHDHDVWKNHRGYATKEAQIINLMAVLFNTMGYAHELLKATHPGVTDGNFRTFEAHRDAENAERAARAASQSRSREAGRSTKRLPKRSR